MLVGHFINEAQLYELLSSSLSLLHRTFSSWMPDSKMCTALWIVCWLTHYWEI